MIVFIPATQKWFCDLNCNRCKARNKAGVGCIVVGNGLTLQDALATSLHHGITIDKFMKPKDEWENRISHVVPQDDAPLFYDVLENATDTVH